MRTLVAVLVLVLNAVLPGVAQAQTLIRPAEQAEAAPGDSTADPGEHGASLFSGLGRAFSKLPSKNTVITLGIGGALAIAIHPADRVITERANRSEPLDQVFELGETAGGGWVQGGAAVATFVVGHMTDHPRVRAVGADLVQAQIVSSAITQGLKISVGRSRPDGSRFSFPSGHASGTFATATVLSRHFGWKVGLPAYGFATYVAASRLQENRHYASDVIVGAVIGIVSGRSVTVGRGAARFAVSPVAVPGGAGVRFTHLQ